MKFKTICKVLNKINSISGINEKIALIKSVEDEDLKEVYKWLFDNSRISGIAEKKFEKDYGFELAGDFRTCDQKTIVDVFRYLDFHHTGASKDVIEVKDLMNKICSTDEEKECFKKLVCKNYPMGIDYKTINKVFPNLIPSYEVMLADKYLDLNENKKAKLFAKGREFCIQEKLDGFRCTAWKENGNVKLISRQGKLIEGLVDIENAIKNLSLYNFVLDGELLLTDRENIPSKEQYKATSKIVSTKDKEKHGITFNVFDLISTGEWNDKECLGDYLFRYEHLQRLIFSENKSSSLELVENIYIGNDVSQIDKYLSEAKEKGWEGIMVRFMDSKYEWKRSSNLLKVKSFLEMDMRIIGLEEGTNSNKGRLGALICEVNHPQYGKIKTKVGGGFAEFERIAFWDMKDELIGRIVSVQYFEVTQNTTTNEYSLRFPEFLELKPIGQEINN